MTLTGGNVILKCVNGHDRCYLVGPDPDCPYCEKRAARTNWLKHQLAWVRFKNRMADKKPIKLPSREEL